MRAKVAVPLFVVFVLIALLVWDYMKHKMGPPAFWRFWIPKDVPLATTPVPEATPAIKDESPANQKSPEFVPGQKIGMEQGVKSPEFVPGQKIGMEQGVKSPEFVPGQKIGMEQGVKSPEFVPGQKIVEGARPVSAPMTYSKQGAPLVIQKTGMEQEVKSPEFVPGQKIGMEQEVKSPEFVPGQKIGMDQMQNSKGPAFVKDIGPKEMTPYMYENTKSAQPAQQVVSRVFGGYSQPAGPTQVVSRVFGI